MRLTFHRLLQTRQTRQTRWRSRLPWYSSCSRIRDLTSQRISLIPQARAFSELLAHAHCFDAEDPAQTRRLVDDYLELVARVPVFALEYQPRPAATSATHPRRRGGCGQPRCRWRFFIRIAAGHFAPVIKRASNRTQDRANCGPASSRIRAARPPQAPHPVEMARALGVVSSCGTARSRGRTALSRKRVAAEPIGGSARS